MREVTKSSGETKQSVMYSSYGEPVVTPTHGEVELNVTRLYTGRDYERETGDYYYRARYYNPSTGRFLSEDPIGFRAKDPNFYRYVGNNSLIRNDPNGKSWTWVAIGGALVAIWIVNDIADPGNSEIIKAIDEAGKAIDDTKKKIGDWWDEVDLNPFDDPEEESSSIDNDSSKFMCISGV